MPRYKMEICYDATNVISHLFFDSEEKAIEARDSISPHLGDRFKNDKKSLIIETNNGSVEVVCHKIIAVRVYDEEKWQNDQFEFTAENRKKALTENIAERIRIRDAGVENIT